mgnify:FL=1
MTYLETLLDKKAKDHVCDQVYGQNSDQVWGQVEIQVYRQVWDQVQNQVLGQVFSQASKASDQVLKLCSKKS